MEITGISRPLDNRTVEVPSAAAAAAALVVDSVVGSVDSVLLLV